MTRFGSVFRTSARAVATRLIPPRYRLRLTARYNLHRGEPELRLLPQLLERGRAFVDVGGNVGIYAARAEQLTDRVYVVEPHPALAQRLRRSLRPTSRVLEVALSDQAGTAVLWVPAALSRCSLEREANGGLSADPVDVAAVRLDDLDLPPVGLIKIDVEGHELAVLRGARATLGRDRPALLVEVEERHHPDGSAAVFDELAGLGYRGFFLHRHEMHAIEDYDFALYQKPENAKSPDGDRHPDYVNNFIFVHGSDTTRLARLNAVPRSR